MKSEINEEDIASIYYDEENDVCNIYLKDQLINQLQVVCLDISKSFDSTFMDEFINLSSVFSETLPYIFHGIKNAKAKNNVLLINCGDLLLNSMDSITASLQTLRCGYKLQSGILLRSSIEICATIFNILSKEGALNDLKSDKLNSNKSISFANKQVPLFGKISGLLSKQLIHINSLHTVHFKIQKFQDKNEKIASVTLGLIELSTIIFEITAELTFNEDKGKLKYWEKIENGGFKFIPPNMENFSRALELLSK